LATGEGRNIQLGYLWRSDGEIHFFDDPSVVYTVSLDAGQASAPVKESDPGVPGFLFGVLAGAILAFAAVFFLGRRRMRS
jgi:hypothetical protein